MSMTLLRMKGVTKSFGPTVKVLHGIKLDVQAGEVHALVGENGAGKSTLVKILTGVYQKDEGEIYFAESNGELQPRNITGVKDAQSIGISIVHQEMPLNDNLNVSENIFLGREPTRLGGLSIDKEKMLRDSVALCKRVNLQVDPKTRVSRLSIGQKQQLEIAKCLSLNARMIIFDEPTTALTVKEAEALFGLIRELKSKGIGIIYISHKFDEIFSLSDHITVIRDGRYIDTLETSSVDQNKIISLMVGRELNLYEGRTPPPYSGEIMLSVQRLGTSALLKDINFNIHKGEIVGFFGLLGAGRTELARAIFGIDKFQTGMVAVDGKTIASKGPADAIRAGLGYVPEDRRREGLVLGMSIRGNATLAFLREMHSILFGSRKEEDLTKTYISDLSVSCKGQLQPIRELSGGNQQKVLIAKWLATRPKVLILDEPTRGIDVKSKSQIHELITDLASKGMSVMVISSEIEEILNVSSRVIVMHEGRITLDVPRAGLDSEKIMFAALGRGGK